MGTDRHDPVLVFHFRVKADNEVLGGFNEVSGLDIETDTERFVEGGVNQYEQQLPGPSKFSGRIVLKSGITDSTKVWDWYRAVMAGQVVRKTVSIYLLDSQGNTQRSWVFQGAVPVKWGGPQLKADGSEVAMETLELVHRGLVPG
jgi:phage tail-like protein